ncbi:hypothetical protein LEP1GSC199_1283 [Leptospira vanthielii serovar Holland str. Waz Holland = ATCC 700522]|uniref:Uncharacterized protein n=1 Tax=Leptospira vanthielii serovar Holland str. Waz Holland = ATCC 700522 TaxID=1218591 RepID=N1WAG0_9LEPT|nr:hypothetical protein LEP1GSC199_1283 [Leptospira vanthielii serovar Holland str. Waz Holland = ATCC 700522]
MTNVIFSLQMPVRRERRDGFVQNFTMIEVVFPVFGEVTLPILRNYFLKYKLPLLVIHLGILS